MAIKCSKYLIKGGIYVLKDFLEQYGGLAVGIVASIIIVYIISIMFFSNDGIAAQKNCKYFSKGGVKRYGWLFETIWKRYNRRSYRLYYNFIDYWRSMGSEKRIT